ncbi:MAG: hypothetical protein M0Z51_16850 [Propionibacterium sp.]|nr:hypothetical protein [Propionibacterium sp.]
MTTHVPVMQVAFELVEQAEAAGIPIGSVDTYGHGDYMTIRIQPANDDDAPRLAALLGLTNRRTQPYDDGGIEAFSAIIGTASVATQRFITAEQVTA